MTMVKEEFELLGCCGFWAPVKETIDRLSAACDVRSGRLAVI